MQPHCTAQPHATRAHAYARGANRPGVPAPSTRTAARGGSCRTDPRPPLCAVEVREACWRRGGGGPGRCWYPAAVASVMVVLLVWCWRRWRWWRCCCSGGTAGLHAGHAPRGCPPRASCCAWIQVVVLGVVVGVVQLPAARGGSVPRRAPTGITGSCIFLFCVRFRPRRRLFLALVAVRPCGAGQAGVASPTSLVKLTRQATSSPPRIQHPAWTGWMMRPHTGH